MEPDLRPGADRQERIPRLVADAVAVGVRRLVLLSAYGVGHAADGHPLKAAEQAVRGSGVDWTVLQSDWFAQNFSESWLEPWPCPPGTGACRSSMPRTSPRSPPRR